MNIAAILHDEEFVTWFTLRRVAESVDEQGRATHTTQDRVISGVVLPATDKQKELLPEQYYTKETIAVYASCPLTPGSPEQASDRILWQGDEYEIVQVKDCMHHGGYSEALAVSSTLLGRGLE